jgi:hypothetical protein
LEINPDDFALISRELSVIEVPSASVVVEEPKPAIEENFDCVI